MSGTGTGCSGRPSNVTMWTEEAEYLGLLDGRMMGEGKVEMLEKGLDNIVKF